MPAQGESRRSATEFGKSQEVWYWGLLRRAPAGLGAKSCDHWFFWAWRMTVSHAAYPLNSSGKEKMMDVIWNESLEHVFFLLSLPLFFLGFLHPPHLRMMRTMHLLWPSQVHRQALEQMQDEVEDHWNEQAWGKCIWRFLKMGDSQNQGFQ